MIVVDASVALKWLIDEEGSAAAERIATMPEVIAPDLMLAEVGSALWKKARRGEIPAEGVDELLESLTLLLDETYEIAPRVVPAFRIAQQLDHSIYDCIYIALAQELGVRMVTADAKLAAKCRKVPFEGMVVTMEEAING